MSAVIIEPITLQMRGCTSSGGHSRLPDLLLLCGLSPCRIAAPLPVAQTRNLGACVVKGEEQAPLVGSLRISLVRPQKLHWARHMKRKGLLHSQALERGPAQPSTRAVWDGAQSDRRRARVMGTCRCWGLWWRARLTLEQHRPTCGFLKR